MNEFIEAAQEIIMQPQMGNIFMFVFSPLNDTNEYGKCAALNHFCALCFNTNQIGAIQVFK